MISSNVAESAIYRDDAIVRSSSLHGTQLAGLLAVTRWLNKARRCCEINSAARELADKMRS